MDIDVSKNNTNGKLSAEKDKIIEIENSLLTVFKALDRKQVSYSLLRGFDELTDKVKMKEVDLLVSKAEMNEFVAVVTQLGYQELPPWGYAPHRFFVTYDATADTWLKLDVVNDLVYGAPIRWLKFDYADECLKHREREEPTYTLSPADEFVTLFLHCLLDKRQFRKERLERLLFLKELAENNLQMKKRIVGIFSRYLPAPLSWLTVIRLLGSNNKKSFNKHLTGISRKLFWLNPLGNTYRKFSTIFMRRMRPFLFMLKRQGLWVALLAPDGGGKSTLSFSLLEQPFLRSKLIYMGANLDSSTVGLPTTRWLKDKIKGMERKKTSKLIVKPLKMIAYINRVLEQWYRVAVGIYHKMLGRTVVFDRFVYDSYLSAPPKTKGQKMRRWLIRSTCPEADVAYFLDAPGQVLFDRKVEHSPAVLERQRQRFLSLQDVIRNMVIVDGTQSAQGVRSQILTDIWKMYGARENGKNNEGNG